MTELTADAFRTVGPGDAIPDDFVVPFYGEDRHESPGSALRINRGAAGSWGPWLERER
jgi:hypothetical protein